MRIKVTVQEEMERPTENSVIRPTETYWVTVDESTSDDPRVIAMTLRAIADRYDPPRKAMRVGYV